MRRDSEQNTFELSEAEQKGRLLAYGPALTGMATELKEHVIHCRPLPGDALPFPDFTFDVALCVDYLFLDASVEDMETHVHAIKELARVAKDVRIFPVVAGFDEPSPLLGPVLLQLNQDNYGVEVRNDSSVGGAMLHVWAQQCQI